MLPRGNSQVIDQIENSKTLGDISRGLAELKTLEQLEDLCWEFAKSEQPWVEALCAIIADDAGLLAKGQDASFQNKVHLGMQAKGFDRPEG